MLTSKIPNRRRAHAGPDAGGHLGFVGFGTLEKPGAEGEVLLLSPELFYMREKLEAVFCLPVVFFFFSSDNPWCMQAPGLFGFLRREAFLLHGSYQKNCTQKMAVSSCLGP